MEWHTEHADKQTTKQKLGTYLGEKESKTREPWGSWVAHLYLQGKHWILRLKKGNAIKLLKFWKMHFWNPLSGPRIYQLKLFQQPTLERGHL